MRGVSRCRMRFRRARLHQPGGHRSHPNNWSTVRLTVAVGRSKTYTMTVLTRRKMSHLLAVQFLKNRQRLEFSA